MNKPNPTDQPRFLVIDDDQTFCSVLERSLTRHGFEATSAHDGASALEAAKELQPSHAVVDLKLEQDSGLQLIPDLLKIKQDMKIVMLTGYGSIPTAVDAIKAGAINYLAKPVDMDTLLAAFDAKAANTETEEEVSPMSLKRLEWEHIQRVLDENDGNISATARKLGMHRRTLQRKLQKRPVKQ